MTAGFGPSSNVSAIASGSPVRRIVAPNICDDGATAPQANTPAAAAAAPAEIPAIGPTRRIVARRPRGCQRAWRGIHIHSSRLLENDRMPAAIAAE